MSDSGCLGTQLSSDQYMTIGLKREGRLQQGSTNKVGERESAETSPKGVNSRDLMW